MNAQDFLISEFLEEEDDFTKTQNETLELLEFVRDNAVPLTQDQMSAILLLRENGLNDIANIVFALRPYATPSKKYYDLINKLTLADRIKGNAKLSSILKANANPANAATINPKDLEAKALRERELR